MIEDYYMKNKYLIILLISLLIFPLVIYSYTKNVKEIKDLNNQITELNETIADNAEETSELKKQIVELNETIDLQKYQLSMGTFYNKDGIFTVKSKIQMDLIFIQVIKNANDLYPTTVIAINPDQDHNTPIALNPGSVSTKKLEAGKTYKFTIYAIFVYEVAENHSRYEFTILAIDDIDQ